MKVPPPVWVGYKKEKGMFIFHVNLESCTNITWSGLSSIKLRYTVIDICENGKVSNSKYLLLHESNETTGKNYNIQAFGPPESNVGGAI